jgi:hypothetical protein
MINRLPLEFRAPADANDSGAKASDARAAKGLSQRVLERATSCIGSYPSVSLAAAFVAGLAIGRLVKT